MSKQTLGGLQIRTFTTETISNQWELLGEKPYLYRIARLSAGQSLILEENMAHCLHLYAPQGKHARVTIENKTQSENQTAWVKSKNKIQIECTEGVCTALLGSLKINSISETDIKLFAEDQVKKVEKPWGYELWLTGDPSPHFAFKRIFIKTGTKTSLQYHVHKRETNLLLEGKAGLHYNPTNVPADEFKPQNTKMAILDPISVIDVFPNTVHRLEAMSDILLCEVSTPELDDVVRITDDSGRKDGRIDSEHKR